MVRPATASALEILRRPGFAPALRPDVKFTRSSSSSVVVVTLPDSGRMHQLYDFECLLAKEMDGKRDLDELVRRAKRIVPGSNREQLEKFVIQCAALGMLSNLTVDATTPHRAPPLVGTGATFDQFQAQLHEEIATAKKPKIAPPPKEAPLYSGEEQVTVVNEVPDLPDYPIKTDPDVGDAARRAWALAQAAKTRPQLKTVENRDDDPEEAFKTIPQISASVIKEVREAIAVAKQVPAHSDQARTIPSLPPVRPTTPPEPRTPPERQRVHTPPVIVTDTVPELPAAPPPPPALPPAVEPVSEAAPEPEPPAEEPPAVEPMSTSAAAESQPWVPEKPPFYARRWFRWLRFWGTLVLLVGVLYAIPWPRYVTEECVILPVGRVEVRAELDGILAEVAVDEGAHVKAGDVLARIDDRDLQAQLHQAKAEVDRLTANLSKMKSGSRKEEIARAKATLASRQRDLSFAKMESDRREKLFANGVGSAEQRDQAARDLELKRNAVAEAEADLRLLKAGYRSEEVAVAEADLSKAVSDQQYIEKKLALLTITSPIPGTVMTPKFRERLHDKITAGATVCEVADTSKVKAEIFVPERQIDVVKIGQPTVVKVQSYPLHPFLGEVKFIASAIEERNGERVLRVTTEVDNRDGLLREQMSGYGEINTGKSNVLELLFRRAVRWVRVRFLI